jgi:hypothetical protein
LGPVAPTIAVVAATEAVACLELKVAFARPQLRPGDQKAGIDTFTAMGLFVLSTRLEG